MNTDQTFVHLHLHSQYSLLDGAIRVKDLVKKVKEFEMPAVAVTDHGNMFGAFDFYKQATGAGIKPILGCEVYVATGDRHDKSKRGSHHLILLARTQEGFSNLKYLVSMGYLEGFYYHPRIDKELLAKHSSGLIACTACLGGEVAREFSNGGYEKARAAAKTLNSLFEPGMFFLEVQNNGYDGQAEYNQALRRIGIELDIPLVATNDCHYLTPEDAQAHKVLMCIGKSTTLDDPKNNFHYTDQLYLRNAQEMREVMRDFPDAVENTVRIAQMCESVTPSNPPDLPNFIVPEGQTREDFLRASSHRMLNERFEELAAVGRSVDTAQYRKRLDIELEVICNMNFAGYFLIVQDFINHAKLKGIPVGPGRGSGAGSLVAWALRITNIDPIPLHLLFERFLNPERLSMPDFDVDFCKDRREEVIAYVVEKYGESNVGQIATFHQLKSRSVVRDVGRVMGLAHAEVDPIAKLVPEGPKVTLASALEDESRLGEARAADPRIDQLLSYAVRLENLNRHAGMHAAGVVIGNKPLWEYVPVFSSGDRAAGPTQIVSQFDMNFVEQSGLIKFDFLGLKTLTVIDHAVKLLNRRPDVTTPVNIDTIPLDDARVYNLISSGNTWGVFQLESSGFQELLKKLKPDCFEDIVAAVALYRPGPLEGGMVADFVECKHGRKQIVYPHPKLEKILKETYGVIVYQEQVMQAAQILSGYSLGAADIMRRAMGKKKVEEMAKERMKFVDGAQANGIDPAKANEIFDLIDKFAGYGFNKSHSAAYALITYQTAWLKTLYPVEFEAALLTCDREDMTKIAENIRLGKIMGIKVLPPHINRSDVNFSVFYPEGDPQGSILFGLGAIKGVGDAALESILESRKDGEFKDIFDFTMRVDLSRVNKGVMESLIRAGAFDFSIEGTEWNRGNIYGALEKAIERGKGAQKDRNSGQTSLFGALAGPTAKSADGGTSNSETGYQGTTSWSTREILAHEKTACGIFMSGHPMEPYVAEAARLTSATTASITGKKDRDEITIAGIIMEYSERKTKAGALMGLGAIEDLEGRLPFLLFAKNLEKNSAAMRSTVPVLLKGSVMTEDTEEGDKTYKISVLEVTPLTSVREQLTREVHINVDGNAIALDGLDVFKSVLARHQGRCDAFLEVSLEGTITTIALPDRFRLATSDELVADLRRLPGVADVVFR